MNCLKNGKSAFCRWPGRALNDQIFLPKAVTQYALVDSKGTSTTI